MPAIGHLQLVAGDGAGAAEVKSIAVREDRQGAGIGRMLQIDGLALRERVWLSLSLGDGAMPEA